MKIIKLINNERMTKTIAPNKACDETSSDVCTGSHTDFAECTIYSEDRCIKDYAGCTNNSFDYCGDNGDYFACHGSSELDFE